MIDNSKGLFSLMVFDFQCGALFFFPNPRLLKYTDSSIQNLWVESHLPELMLTGRMKTSS